MSSWNNGEIVGLSIAFVVTLTLDIALAAMIVKTKRVQERETPDRKRHVDVLFTAVACSEALSSTFVYPLLISIAMGDDNSANSKICTILVSCSIFFASCTASLTVFIDMHGFFSSLIPFRYFIYLKRKSSKIPFICIGCSICVGLVSLVLSSCGFHFFRFELGRYFGRTVVCVPELQDNNAIYYYVVLVNLVVWTHLITLIYALVMQCKQGQWRVKSGVKMYNKDCCGMPTGSNFKLSYKILYLLAWAPITVVMTMLSSGYHVSGDVILTCCYIILSTGPLSPFLFYFTHGDFRDTVNETVKGLYLKMNGQHHHQHGGERRVNEGIELHVL